MKYEDELNTNSQFHSQTDSFVDSMACNPDMSVATSPDNGLDAEDMVGPKCSCGPPRCGASNPGADLWGRDGGKEASEAVLPPLINPLAIIVWKSANNKGHAIDGKLPS